MPRTKPARNPGPRDLGDEHYRDDEQGRRRFSPAFFAGLFDDFEVSVVVRLNEEHYDGRAFADHGMALIYLPFDDCTAPPPAVAEAFLAAAAPGPVAVRCQSGPGRTGPQIALHMKRPPRFTARAAHGAPTPTRPGLGARRDAQPLAAAGR